MYTRLIALVALVSSAAAKTCHNFTVPVQISARTGIFDNIATPQTNLDATTFILNATRRAQNFSDIALSGYRTTSGLYNISAKFCIPSGANATLTNPTVQILTHGIGFDKTYWDLPYNNYNYSYIDTAVDGYGYCTLSYDRLGIGNSSHGDPKNEIQSFLEIAALAEITRMLRNGTLPTVNHAFSTIVHVGHSFGAAQSYALTAMYPNISDGIILTGWAMNASFVGLFAAGADFQQANLNQPLRFGSQAVASAINTVVETFGLTDYVAPIDFLALPRQPYVNGYLANSNVNSQLYLFFLPPFFDPGLLYYGEANKQPAAIGELLTLPSLPATNSFAGPVLVFTGSADLPYCAGNCLSTGDPSVPSIPAGAKSNFPNASPFETYIQPNTGHGLNFHYNATAGYVYIQNFLQAHGLQGC